MVNPAVISAAALLSTRAANTSNITTSGDGCAQLSQYIHEHPDVRFPPPSRAYACLKALPVDVKGDIQLVSEIYNILTWQSTLAYLKDPPNGYPNPPVDLLVELEDIQEKISDNGFESEYDVQQTITTLLNKAYDGHLGYSSDITSVISFGKLAVQADLVSLSLDGKSLPKVYLKTDIDAVHYGANFTPSAVQAINNQTAYDYLVSFSDNDASCHDPDARYQNLFYNSAAVSQTNKSTTFFSTAPMYMGDTTTLGHENGTTTVLDNFASVDANLTGINSGAAFFDAFLDRPPMSSTTSTSATTSPTATPSSKPLPTAYNYPYPVQKASDNSVSGYFLNSTSNTSSPVAVLSSPSFLPANTTEFQNTVRLFLAAATAARKTRLIIDLRHNGGGAVQLGFDLFKQLFPAVEPYGGTRLRAVPAIDAMGNVTSGLADAIAAAADGNNQTALEEALVVTPTNNVVEFWYRTRVDAAHRNFSSWADEFGPQSLHGDDFTHIVRANWSGPWNGAVSGYGELADVPPQPFRPEDVVLLQDGYCASTCAVFAELMRTQAPGVRSVVVGGRPRNGPAVGVGGTKGAETITFDQVVGKAARVVELVGDDDEGKMVLLNETGVVALAETEVLLRRAARDPETGRLSSSAINYRNNHREGDASDPPLHFVTDYADCRLWYSMPMLHDPVAVWDAVVDVMWKGAECVPGSTGYGNVSSIGGGGNGTAAEESTGGAAGGLGMSGLAVVACGVVVVMAMF